LNHFTFPLAIAQPSSESCTAASLEAKPRRCNECVSRKIFCDVVRR
jgi:hypothetical protein